MNFNQRSKEEKEALVEALCRRHGWTRMKAVEELEQMDEVALAYIKVEERLARKAGMGYDPYSEFWQVK